MKRYIYSSNDRFDENDREIQVRKNGKWYRWAITWDTYLEQNIANAKAKGYSDEDIRVETDYKKFL